MILPKIRDPRLVTVRRGGSLSDADHHALARWAADCAKHVLDLFERSKPADARPRNAIDAARAWARGVAPMMATRALGGHAMGAARPLRGAPRFAAYAAGQAACVAHVPEHDLGAAAYSIKAVQAAASADHRFAAGLAERDWQRSQLPEQLRELVLQDQQRRNSICWNVFDD
ncbi:MAG: putative immunity protein [Antricoccus sp.]